MKRSHKIARLTAIQFSARELNGMDNTQLDAIYQQAKPLLDAHSVDVAAAQAKENEKLNRQRQRFAANQHNRAVEADFHLKWKPPQKITANRAPLETMLHRLTVKAAELTELFRKTGDTTYADQANSARTAIRELQQEAE